jgi:hypothetical protein
MIERLSFPSTRFSCSKITCARIPDRLTKLSACISKSSLYSPVSIKMNRMTIITERPASRIAPFCPIHFSCPDLVNCHRSICSEGDLPKSNVSQREFVK